MTSRKLRVKDLNEPPKVVKKSNALITRSLTQDNINPPTPFPGQRKPSTLEKTVPLSLNDENEEPRITENEEGAEEEKNRTVPVRRSSRVRNQQKVVVEIGTRTTCRRTAAKEKEKEAVAVLKENRNTNVNGLTTITSTPRLTSNNNCHLLFPSTPTSSPAIPTYLTPTTMRLISTANGQRTPQTPTNSVYQEGKSLFRRTAAPTCLVGRSAERETIRQFWNNHVIANRAGSLYLSGAPGTGKTALMDETVRILLPPLQGDQKNRCKVEVHVVNCMAVADPKGIYSKILAEISSENLGAKDAVRALADLFCGEESKKSSIYVVVLDEIDCLITRDQEVLYKLFEWPTLPDSRLVLIGIANALDLTDRFLPRLRAKNIEPQLLHFNPYQVSEITEIIKDRLRSLANVPTVANSNGEEDPFTTSAKPDSVPLMQTTAIELCARKVAGATGDLRKALDVCRQAIELVESETRNSKLKTDDAADWKRALALSSAPKVTISHVLKVLSSAFGSAGLQKLRNLALQQKQLLAVYLLARERNKNAETFSLSSSFVGCTTGGEITVASLYESYVFETGRQKLLAAVSRSEYVDMISCLESSGIFVIESRKSNKRRRMVKSSAPFSSGNVVGGMGILRGEDQRDRTVSLTVQEPDVVKAVSETPVLKTFYVQGLRFEDRTLRNAGDGAGMGMGMVEGF